MAEFIDPAIVPKVTLPSRKSSMYGYGNLWF